MNDYRRSYREVQSEYYWTLPRVVFALFIGMALLGTVGFVFNLLSQPARIVTKTFDADNVITKYEWFYDAHGNLQARVAQVRQFKDLTAKETDPSERNRLRIEMAAIQQSCRDLARRYNANAQKANQSIFMGSGVPSSFDAGQCE